jgi:hypothetical protein
LSAECSEKLSAQSPPCSRKALPLQIARFAGEDQRREAGELALDVSERRQVAIDRRLLDRQIPPARWRPPFHFAKLRKINASTGIEGHLEATPAALIEDYDGECDPCPILAPHLPNACPTLASAG